MSKQNTTLTPTSTSQDDDCIVYRVKSVRYLAEVNRANIISNNEAHVVSELFFIFLLHLGHDVMSLCNIKTHIWNNVV